MNKFSEIMAEKEDYQLKEILENKEDYTEEALRAARYEFDKRGLSLTEMEEQDKNQTGEEIESIYDMKPPHVSFLKGTEDQLNFGKRLDRENIAYETEEVKVEEEEQVNYYCHPEDDFKIYNILNEMNLLV